MLLLPLLNKSMHWTSIVYKQRHLYHLLKTPNYIALFISPDNYDIAVNRKENANVLMFLMFQWLWLLTIVKFIITQPFAKHRFLKKISAWLLLTSKFFSQFNSMFCYHKFRMLQKGFSLLFFAWSVKWWVSLNHPRDWINNFPGIREENHSLQRNHSAIYIFPVYCRLLFISAKPGSIRAKFIHT